MDNQWETITNSALQQARGELASVKGKTEALQHVIVPSEVAQEVQPAVAASSDVSVSTPDSVGPVEQTVPASPSAPVASPAIQSVIEVATQAGQAAYQQVVKDLIQALSVAK